MFKKLFAKKNDGFYAQAEDDTVTPKPEAKAKPAEVTVAATETPSAPPGLSAKADKKSAAKADKKSAKPAAPKVSDAPAPVAATPAPTAPTITNFATDYLIKPSSISSRRLPGANMSGFLDLARQVTKPVNIK